MGASTTKTSNSPPLKFYNILPYLVIFVVILWVQIIIISNVLNNVVEKDSKVFYHPRIQSQTRQSLADVESLSLLSNIEEDLKAELDQRKELNQRLENLVHLRFNPLQDKQNESQLEFQPEFIKQLEPYLNPQVGSQLEQDLNPKVGSQLEQDLNPQGGSQLEQDLNSEKESQAEQLQLQPQGFELELELKDLPPRHRLVPKPTPVPSIFDQQDPKFNIRELGNYEPIQESGPENQEISAEPGEGGIPYILPESRNEEAERSIGMYKGICVAASNDISLTRSIPDTRVEECKYLNYPEMNTTVSVIVIFHNEGFSTLMRTVHSVLNRSPVHIIKEIILIDDRSNHVETQENLENYIRIFEGKVKLFRNSEREGLIRSRNVGARKATGDILVFLDAHCEANRNWLPPLLAPILKNYKTMTVPIIDGIDYRTFAYTSFYDNETLPQGIWDWTLEYQERILSKNELSHNRAFAEPYKSPTHAGGLFAISRSYFEELGYYDEGLEVWGGEQYELSFKVWQCGGTLLWVPCSRVGHAYKGPILPNYSVSETYKSPKDVPGVVQKNLKRVVEVWWDSKYKDYFYTSNPIARFLDHGDISKQLDLKERLKCESFEWFMENVAPVQLLQNPPPPPNLIWGALRNNGTKTCFDGLGGHGARQPGLYPCHGGSSQIVRLNIEGQLYLGDYCWSVKENKVVQLVDCNSRKVDGLWRYNSEQQAIMYDAEENTCLAADQKNNFLVITVCDNANPYQQWTWEEPQH